MPHLKNDSLNMEIGYVMVGRKYQLYVQEGNERQYYGTLIGGQGKEVSQAPRTVGQGRRWRR